MPPMLPPVVAMPVAAARRTEKKWAIEETAGVKIREVPRPAAREKERMKCHSSARGVQVRVTVDRDKACKGHCSRGLD